MLGRCRATLGVSTLTLGRLEIFSHFADISRPGHPFLNISQRLLKPDPPGPLALPLTRVRVPWQTPRPTHARTGPEPGPPPPRPLRHATPRSSHELSPRVPHHTRDGSLRATPGQAMVWPSASPPQFPHLFASLALRFQRHAVPRPGPTAQPRLVYSLTLHPETQPPATRTPARYGHAPAPQPRLAPPLLARAHSEGGSPGLRSSQVCVFAKVMQL